MAKEFAEVCDSFGEPTVEMEREYSGTWLWMTANKMNLKKNVLR